MSCDITFMRDGNDTCDTAQFCMREEILHISAGMVTVLRVDEAKTLLYMIELGANAQPRFFMEEPGRRTEILDQVSPMSKCVQVAWQYGYEGLWECCAMRPWSVLSDAKRREKIAGFLIYARKASKSQRIIYQRLAHELAAYFEIDCDTLVLPK